MKLVKLICGEMERYAFIEKMVNKVRTENYFEYDELGDNAPYWTIVQPISKEEYEANYLTILDELEDTICFVDDFMKLNNIDIENIGNISDKEFFELEHQYILTQCF